MPIKKINWLLSLPLLDQICNGETGKKKLFFFKFIFSSKVKEFSKLFYTCMFAVMAQCQLSQNLFDLIVSGPQFLVTFSN